MMKSQALFIDLRRMAQHAPYQIKLGLIISRFLSSFLGNGKTFIRAGVLLPSKVIAILTEKFVIIIKQKDRHTNKETSCFFPCDRHRKLAWGVKEMLG